MPQVPVLNNIGTSINDAPQPQVTDSFSAAEGEAPGLALEKAGQKIQKAGADVGDISLDIADRANQLRVNDVMNQAHQRALDLTYNPTDGYQALKGKDALDRVDASGKPIALADEYGNKLKSTMNDLAGSLANPAQQELFAKQSNDLYTSFTGNVEQHVLGQYGTYHTSVNDGAIKLATEGASAAGISNPKATQGYIETIRSANASNQQYNGKSANEITADTDAQVSAIHANAIENGIANNDTTGAAQWFNANKGQMIGSDILKTQNQINTKLDGINAMKAVGTTQAKMAGRMIPGANDVLTNLVFGQESNNMQKGGPGSVVGPDAPTTSPKGAIGIAQIMPATGPEAAKLAGVDWDPDKFLNDGVYNRALGTAYLNKQLQDFGDLSKALAAYNAGPQATKDAIATAQKAGDPNWLQHLPKETQDYVTKITRQYDAGQGIPPIPTEQEFVNDAVANLGENPRMEAIMATRESAKSQYTLAVDARKQQADAAQGRVQAELQANGGSMTLLSPSAQEDLKQVNRLDPDKGLGVLRFATATQNTDKVATNIDAYTQAMTYPEELAKMPDAEFQNFLITNFSKADQEKVAQKRADAINGTGSTAAGSINSAAVHQSLSTRLSQIGIPSSGKLTTSQASHFGAVLHFVNDSIFDQQKQMGRKMTPEEIDEHVSNLFSQSIEMQNAVFAGTHPVNMLATTDIPTKDEQAIVDNFKVHGIQTPTQQDILEKWWKVRSAGRS